MYSETLLLNLIFKELQQRINFVINVYVDRVSFKVMQPYFRKFHDVVGSKY